MTDAEALRGAIDAVIRRDHLTELLPVTGEAADGRFDAGDRDLLVQDHLVSMRSLRGSGCLIVQGSIRGEEGSPVRLEFDGDILVAGSVKHAVLRADHILIGGTATAVEAVAASGAGFVKDVHGCSITVGAFEGDRHRIDATRAALTRTREARESVARRVATDEKRLARSCHALRLPIDFSVGRIVRHSEGRVHVDLNSFYDSLEGRNEEQLATALSEFFTKGIIGVITRQNRKYLVNFPAREKVFMQLVRDLRELFGAVLERDRLQRRARGLELRIDDLIRSLERRATSIEVGGTIAGTTGFEFILPRVIPRGGVCEFLHHTARLDICEADGGAIVTAVAADGERARSTLLASELEGQRFTVQDGCVLWEPAAEPVSA